MAGIYVHIPFCGKLCSYCDFHFSVSLKDRERMIDAMVREIELRSDFFENREINTLYLGGGTPSILTTDELWRIVNKISSVTDISLVKEFTIEVNPEDINVDYLRELRCMGINRLSIGIQSFDDATLRFFNRRHNSTKAQEVIKIAKEVGFDNISIDLIYGVEPFDESVWHNSVERALQMEVEHISAYHLTIDSGSVLWHKLSKGEVCEVDELRSQREFDYLHQRLLEGGYDHYEVSNFAKKDHRAIHNSSYWAGIEYLGIGASAHSYIDGYRQWNISNNRRYLEGVESGNMAIESEQLSRYDRYNEYVMISLRTDRGVSLSQINNKFGSDLADHFSHSAERFVNENRLVRNGDNYVIESRLFLISDSIISELFH